MKRKVEGVWAELSAKKAEKVDLSAVSDIDDAYSMLERAVREADAAENEVANFSNRLDKLMSEGRDVMKKLDNVSSLIQENINDSEQALDQFDRLANELGMQGRENDSYNQLKNLMDDEAMYYISKMDMYYKDIKDSINL